MHSSPLDSNRFKLSVHRSTCDSINAKEIKNYIIDNKVDVLIFRINSNSKNDHYKLSLLGMPYIHCDSLVYYKCNLQKQQINNLRNNLTFKIVTKNDIPILKQIVPKIFMNYKNHYFSNPKLDKSNIIEGYTEWATSYLNEVPERISWLVLKDGEIVGFATCSHNLKTKKSEGVLYGILPEKSGGGIYGDLIRFTQSHYKNLGYEEMLVSTQVQNYAVQKVWAREGFYMFKAYDTYHINSFLSNLNIDYKEDITITEEELHEFGVFSGDLNPIHLYDEAAQKAGFKSKIVHGVKFELILTRILGQNWPGEGTIILDNKIIFKNPIYPLEPYEITVRCIHEKSNGFKELVSQMYEKSTGKIVCIAYTNVLKR